MIKRELGEKLTELAKQFPVVTIEGPRQSGKTTLARAVFPDFTYVNLEDRVIRLLAEQDEKGFFLRFKPPLIIDEIQRVPALLSAVQVEVDRLGGNGLFILTGSHQPSLKAGIAQSLAGRTALVTLLPFSVRELVNAGVDSDSNNFIFNGFMPAIYDRKQNPVDAYRAYFQTYVERDVRQLVNISRQREFELFLRLLAGRVGQIVNLEGMSGEIGVSAATLKGWLNVLEASHIVFRLPPYHNNFGKRFAKSPKLYFTEVGLAAHLLGITSADQVYRDPLAGGLFENMVVLEALKARLNRGLPPSLYFMREKSGVEVDMILETGRTIGAIEIKSSHTPEYRFTKNMRTIGKIADNMRSENVVYSGEDWPDPQHPEFVNFRNTANLIDSLGIV